MPQFNDTELTAAVIHSSRKRRIRAQNSCWKSW